MLLFCFKILCLCNNTSPIFNWKKKEEDYNGTNKTWIKTRYLGSWCICFSAFISCGWQFVHVTVRIQGWFETVLYQSVTSTQKATGHPKSIRYNGVSLYQGCFSYILLLLWRKISFIIPSPSSSRGSLCRCTSVFLFLQFLLKEGKI